MWTRPGRPRSDRIGPYWSARTSRGAPEHDVRPREHGSLHHGRQPATALGGRRTSRPQSPRSVRRGAAQLRVDARNGDGRRMVRLVVRAAARRPDGATGRDAAPRCARIAGNRRRPRRPPGPERRRAVSAIAGCEADLVFVGHTHWPARWDVAGVEVVSVGSVSNPLAPDLRASYVILEANESGYAVEHSCVSYDLEAAIAATERVRHPAAAFITRHFRGKIVPHWRR